MPRTYLILLFDYKLIINDISIIIIINVFIFIIIVYYYQFCHSVFDNLSFCY